jgi:uncharacterized protein (DUF58 family)
MGLLDRAAKRLLEQLHLTVRPQATDVGQGGHRSRARAAGLEFADHRMYVPGDDIRHIDWKAFARHRQLLLKTFEEERDIYIYVLLDQSLSMTRGEPSKLDVGKSLAAAFAYLGMKQFDRVRLIPFASELGHEQAPARSKTGFPQLEKALAGLEPGGVTRFADTTRAFAERHTRRGLVVVVSDLMEASDWGESFRTLARLGHELWVVRVTCDEDSRPDFRGELELRDVERDTTVRVRIGPGVLDAYAREVRAHVDRCAEACRKVGGRFVEAPVERPLEELLRVVLAPSARAA